MEPSDRIALTDLAARYAQAVDRRNPTALAALFTENAKFVLPPALNGTDAPTEISGNAVISTSVVGAVAHLHSTRHIVEQQILDQDSATTAHGEAYCSAHHIYPRREDFRNNRIEIRYQDNFEKVAGTWLFSRRELVVDFAEDVPVILLGK
ncbi:nuclear transport factor 2 family protein [Rhodococcus sp. ARC_M6]|uniref:nuclear transport factor 2 family protein n=1 Tax=Rhodococcus sp. ARC_M6 TaxID=2928852 RepID=UPI001FB3B700|nr:nuclear transport factor 2 family protein [Rhodococcus sp. ARC_M6]MCJ0907303.1 nuclear transport factor 2 family protein [Rhodococcus sp. ARC_M6]